MGGRARLARTLGCFFGSRHGVLNWDVIMPKNWSLAFCRQMAFVWITILAFSRFWASLDFASHEIILGSIGRVWCPKSIDQNLSCYDSVPKWTHLDFFPSWVFWRRHQNNDNISTWVSGCGHFQDNLTAFCFLDVFRYLGERVDSLQEKNCTLNQGGLVFSNLFTLETGLSVQSETPTGT